MSSRTPESQRPDLRDGAYPILYVEDEEPNLILMQHLTSLDRRARLTCVTNDTEGIAAAIQQCPHLIALDM